MKKSILFMLTLAFVGLANAQESSFDPYLSAGLSMSNTDDAPGSHFSSRSYPSIEFGVMKNNFSLGLVAGRGSLSGFDSDAAGNYWSEIKTAISFPMGNFSGYGLLGIGSYFSNNELFIEYGAGFSYTFNKFGVFAQASNWDGIWYATPGISYTF